ncbi:MAG: LytR C-terminal domain-containing protein, partial [Micrococcaceae bacterium]|nr:LytR C-terminal domain-containing protein [Micrococcaceae bacterium]
MSDERDPTDWHGQRIVTEEDLDEGFSDHDPERVENPRYYRRRLLHGMVLGLLVALVIAALVLAYLVKTGQVVIPALEPAPTPTATAQAEDPAAAVCPQEELEYAKPKDVTVNVYNATTSAGLAAATAESLKKHGFTIGKVANAKLKNADIVGTVVSGTKGRANALTVQRHIKGTEYVKKPKRSADTIDFVIGKKYKAGSIVPKKKVDTSDGQLSCPIAVKEARKKAKESAAASGKADPSP